MTLTPQAPAPELRSSHPPLFSEARRLRADIRTWCAAVAADDDATDDILLVADELFANAVTATSTEHPIDVRLTSHVTCNRPRVVVEVANEGTGLDESVLPGARPGEPGGRGLEIARTLGVLRIVQHGFTTTVSVDLPLDRANH